MSQPITIKKDDPYLFVPTDKQRQIWDLIKKHSRPNGIMLIGYGGAAGGGKTRAIVELAIDLALSFPGNRILVGRRDFNDLSSTVMEAFYRYCPPGLIVRRNNVEHWAELRMAGWPKKVVSVIRFRELKDWMGLGSEEYGAALVDEAAEVSKDSILMLLSRLRWRLPREVDPDGKKMSYYLIAASNPYPGWFKEWFVDYNLPTDILANVNASVHFIPALARDNPHLPPYYEAFLRSIYPQAWVKRLIEGSWDVYIGQVYPQFNPNIHEWKHYLPGGEIFIPEFVRLVGGLDFGEPSNRGHKTCGMVAGVMSSGRVLRLDCFEESSDDVYERLARWMGRMEEKWLPYVKPLKHPYEEATGMEYNQRIIWCADKSQMGWIQEMKKAFIIRPSKGGAGSVRWGIGLVANRLNPDHSGIPGSFYLPHMQNFREAMIRYRWPEWDESGPPPTTPLKVDDDLVDADRYMHELLPTTFGPPEQFLDQIAPVAKRQQEYEENWVHRTFGTGWTRRTIEPFDRSYILEGDDSGDIVIF